MRICGIESAHQSGAKGCQLLTGVAIIAGLAIAAYGAVILSQNNSYSYNQGIGLVSTGGAVAAVAFALLSCACCKSRQRQGQGTIWQTSSAYRQPRGQSQRGEHSGYQAQHGGYPTGTSMPQHPPTGAPPPYAPTAPPLQGQGQWWQQ